MIATTRPISWIKAAQKDFEDFPAPAVQIEAIRALTVAAEGRKADNVKPLKGFDSGVMEIVLRHRGDAFRVVYAVQIGNELWVIHAFQKKSTQGIKTPKHEIDLVHQRIKRLKEIVR
jgi:phage-related protein